MFEAKQKVKIVRTFGTKGAWENKHIGTTGVIAGNKGGPPMMGASGKTHRVDLADGSCLFVEPEALEAA